MVNSEEFAKRLEKVFDHYDLTATSFSEKVNVGKATISHLLSGRNKPSLDFVLKTVKAFPEVELYWLLNGKGSFPTENLPQKDKEIEIDKYHDKQEDQLSLHDQLTDEPAKKESTVSKYPNKKLVRVILCYEDGSFENFDPRE